MTKPTSTLPSARSSRSQLSPVKKTSPLSREALVSWLFLIGSLLFVLDAVLENLKGVSFSSFLHLFAGTLFTVGSALFIPQSDE